MQITQRRSHVGSGVKHIAADYEIERAKFKTLIGRRFFKIEDFRLNFRKTRKFLIRTGEESSRNIGKRIRVQAALERG